jgi:hypothetical protein
MDENIQCDVAGSNPHTLASQFQHRYARFQMALERQASVDTDSHVVAMPKHDIRAEPLPDVAAQTDLPAGDAVMPDDTRRPLSDAFLDAYTAARQSPVVTAARNIVGVTGQPERPDTSVSTPRRSWSGKESIRAHATFVGPGWASAFSS